MSIKLSIIIPIYKEEDYIEECLTSIYDEIKDSGSESSCYEIVVVSDGASELAERRVLKYKDIFVNLSFLKMEHKGAGAARNLGAYEAKGEYISFLDADDKMSKGFLKICNKLLEEKRDLYIFGLKRIEDDKVEYWTVEDREYNSSSDFADEYIRNGHLLVYSNCNKLYKSKIIRDNDIHFNGDIHFGEDRLFNYDYIRHCNTITTSSAIKHDYIKRKKLSLSTMHYDKYFNIVLKLHKEKVKCFIDLPRNVSEAEIQKFAADDLIREIERTILRFELHKDEEKENIELINNLLFEKPDAMSDDIGIFIILGSRNCGYKVKKAIELSSDRPYMKFIVSGGNLHVSGEMTEAEYMAKVLEDSGIPHSNIHIENLAKNTEENLKCSYEIAETILENKDLTNHKKIGLLTSGFHLKRVKLIVNRCFREYLADTLFFSAFGPIVSLDNWYKSENGKNLVFYEIRKNITDDYKIYLQFINS